MGKLDYTATPSGVSSVATAVINGKVEDLMYCSKIEESESVKQVSRRVAGFVREQTKIVGIEASTIKATIFHVTSVFLKLIADYESTGKMPQLTFTRTTTLPNGKVEQKAFYGCYPKSSSLSSIDWSADELEESLEFSYNSAKLLKTF
ncbi:MAG: phage tail tube protein [Clostridium sp.]|jgi:hypothetical protein|nr:phage tail tube protein [Clostridium sp.]